MHVSADERITRLFGEDHARRNGGGNAPLPPLPPPPSRTRYGLSGFSLLFFGVLLPAGTILLELVTNYCAETFYDPIPTSWHALLALTVPLSNALSLLAVRRNWQAPRVRLAVGLLNAFAIGAAACFAVIMLPISILGVIAVLAMGIGLLPLSPALSLASAVMLRVRMRRDGRPAPGGFLGLIGGVSLALAALAAVQLPSAVTLHGLKLAASAHPDESARGVRLLRQWGDDDLLLEACYRPPGRRSDLLTRFVTGDDVATQDVRKVYYRATGRAFNAVAPQGTPGVTTRFDGDWFDDTDAELGAAHVGGRVHGVSLASSRVDGKIDGDAAAAYLEWTLVFANAARVQREARMQVALPPGGVVSRLTLWVDGEEREAAFGKRAQVRQAYQRVAVEQRRDPVLVTTAGPDRILLQCFPIPPGGQMKVRFGVTAPLQLSAPSGDRATLALPSIVERNFAIADGVKHSMWFEGAAPAAQVTELFGGAGSTVRGELSDAALRTRPSIFVRRNPAVTSVTQADLNGDIVQEIQPVARPKPGAVVAVVDGSAGMAVHADQMRDALRATGVAEVIFAGDTVLTQSLGSSPLPAFAGGRDNVPALVRAWDDLAQAPDGVIVWLHGPQPEVFQSPDALRQRFERKLDGPRLLSVQLVPGPNRVIEALDGVAAVTAHAGVPQSSEALVAVITTMTAGGEQLAIARRRVEKPDQPAPPRGSHVARLWAFDRVRELLRHTPPRSDEAAAVAHQYQLVTPASAAVVLETKQQFAEAGLSPVDSANVPTVPEPNVLPIALGAAAVWRWLRRGRG